MIRLVDVYPYRKEQGEVKFVIFKRSQDVIYSGQWRMVGGKVKGEERAYEAAMRELNEETALKPMLLWTLPSVNTFYDRHADAIRHVPVFGAEIDPHSEIDLNHEHSEYQWISEKQIESYISWPEQRRLMRLLQKIILNNEILDDWIIESQK